MIDSVTEEECVNNGYENPDSPGYMQVASAVSKRVRLHSALIRNVPLPLSTRILQSVSKVNGIAIKSIIQLASVSKCLGFFRKCNDWVGMVV